MIDLKLLVIRDLLPITRLSYAKVSPPSLDIYGQHFDQATSVQINDLEAPEFVILSPTRMLAQIPSSQVGSQIRKVAIMAETPSTSRKSRLYFEVGKSIRGLRGIEKLVQTFCKLLLQTPGSDRFYPNIGGGLLALAGINVEREASRSLTSTVLAAVSRTRDQLVSLQSKNRSIPRDERLLAATVESTGFDPNTTTLAVRVSLSAASGKEAVANLTF